MIVCVPFAISVVKIIVVHVIAVVCDKFIPHYQFFADPRRDLVSLYGAYINHFTAINQTMIM